MTKAVSLNTNTRLATLGGELQSNMLQHCNTTMACQLSACTLLGITSNLWTLFDWGWRRENQCNVFLPPNIKWKPCCNHGFPETCLSCMLFKLQNAQRLGLVCCARVRATSQGSSMRSGSSVLCRQRPAEGSSRLEGAHFPFTTAHMRTWSFFFFLHLVMPELPTVALLVRSKFHLVITQKSASLQKK